MIELFLAGCASILAGGVLSLFFREPARGGVYAAFSGAALAALATASVSVLLGWGTPTLAVDFPFPFGAVPLAVDPLSAFFVLILALSNFTAALHSTGYLKLYRRAPQARFYYAGLSVLFTSMLLLVMVRQAIAFLFLWELMSLSSFALVAFDHEKEEARRAAVSYLAAMQAGFAFLLTGFLILAHAAGGYYFASFPGVLAAPGGLGIAVFLFLFVGFGTKAGFVPFHAWLPKAHPAAPAPVSAVMSGVMIKTGIYGLLRLLLWLGKPPLALSYGVLTISLLTALWGVVRAVSQTDLKKVLASSSVENAGLIGCGIGLGMLGQSLGLPVMSALGYLGGIFHVLNHSLFKSLLFMGAGSVYAVAHTRNMERLGGLAKQLPAVSTLFLLGSLALSGLPLLNGFASEIAMYLSALRGLERPDTAQGLALALTLAALALTGALALFCFVRAYGLTFLGLPRSELPKTKTEGSVPMIAAQVIPAVLIVLFGLFPALTLPFLAPLAGELAGAEAQTAAAALSSIYVPLSTAFLVFLAAAAGLFLLRLLLLRRRKVTAVKTWDCGYQTPSPRLQYTAGSFSGIVRGLFAPFRGVRSTRTEEAGQAAAEPETRDPAARFSGGPAARAGKRLLELFLRVQSGNTQQYILYGVVFLIAVIIVIFGLGG